MAAQVTRRKPRVGIIGGSGPEAGADLFLKLQAAHRAKLGAAYATDRDALDVLLWSVSGVGGPRDVGDVAPGSEGFRRTLKALCVTLKELAPLVDVIVVACNTLHAFEAEMLGFLDLIDQPRSKLLSMVSAASSACLNRGAVAVLGGPVTTHPDLSPYAALGLCCELVRLTDVQKDALRAVIWAVKREGAASEDTAAAFVALLDDVAAAGAATVLLACTELPLVDVAAYCAAANRKVPAVDLLDPTRLVAAAVVDAVHTGPPSQ